MAQGRRERWLPICRQNDPPPVRTTIPAVTPERRAIDHRRSMRARRFRRFNAVSSTREVATVAVYPSRGHSHSSESDLSALAAYTHSLLSALPVVERRRHLVLTNIKSGAPGSYTEGEIEVFESWDKGSFRFFIQILRAIRRVPDLKVVHLQHEFNQFGPPKTVPLIPAFVWTVRFILRKKVVITYHEVVGRELLTPELATKIGLPVPVHIALVLLRAYYRVTSFAATEIFVQHDKFRELLRDEMRISKPIHILPIGAHSNVALADRTDSRENYGIQPQELALLYFGLLDWRKGLHVLVEAFGKLPGNDFRLLVAGGQPLNRRDTPEYEAWYSTVAEQMANDPRIENLGFVDEADVPMLFSAADLVVLPYVVPQLVSAVLMHAASYERPFIASEAFSGHLDPSVLFKADADSLAEKILRSFNGSYSELADYSRRFALLNSWVRTAALLAERYNTLLMNSSGHQTIQEN